MIPTEGVYIELRSDAPERLAAFYERLVGMKRVDGPGVLLSSPGLTLAIKPGFDEQADEGGIIFGFRVPDGSDPSELRSSAIAGGAVLLSESKRDGRATLSCQDPDGNAFVIVAMQPAIGIEAAPALASTPPAPAVPTPSAPPRPTTTAAPVSAPPAKMTPGGAVTPPAPPAPPPGGRPTRRDVDRLRDMDRIASMAESIAGLSTPFSEDDPAHVMDRMRAKIPVVTEAELRVREADAEMRAREKQAAVDDLLSQYRAQVLVDQPAPVDAAPTPVQTEKPPAGADVVNPADDDSVLADLDSPHTLGPAAVASADEPDPIQTDAPRTLGRSRAYDEDEDSPTE